MSSQKGLLASPRLPRKRILVWIVGRRKIEPGHTVHKAKEFILQSGYKNLGIIQSHCKLTKHMVCSSGPILLYTVAKHLSEGKPWEYRPTIETELDRKEPKLQFPTSPEGGSKSPAGKAGGTLFCFDLKLFHQNKLTSNGRNICSPPFCFDQFFLKIRGSLNPIQDFTSSKESLICAHFPQRSSFFSALST